MSLNYIDKNGVSHIISGLTPGGNLETGAVATREGAFTVTVPSGDYAITDVTFSEPMPDEDYVVEYYGASTSLQFIFCETSYKTANGFKVTVNNTYNSSLARTINYKAFKLYEVADAEQLYSKVQDLEAMVPSNASSTNKFSTADDLRTETRTLDRRLDDVEDVIPTGASVSNQLATKADVDNATIDELGDIGDVDVSTVTDGQTIIWDDTNSKWVNGQGGKVYSAGNGVAISSADQVSAKINTDQLSFDSSGNINVSNDYKKTFVGTRAQWDVLSAADKKKYNIANITDDAIDCVTVDTVTEGVMKPITSNAVAKDKKHVTLWTGSISSGSMTLSQPYTNFRKLYFLIGIGGAASSAKIQKEILVDFISSSYTLVISESAAANSSVFVNGFNLSFPSATTVSIAASYAMGWGTPVMQKIVGEY